MTSKLLGSKNVFCLIAKDRKATQVFLIRKLVLEWGCASLGYPNSHSSHLSPDLFLILQVNFSMEEDLQLLEVDES